eukprot:Gb_12448 [translate_table: standard]
MSENKTCSEINQGGDLHNGTSEPNEKDQTSDSQSQRIPLQDITASDKRVRTNRNNEPNFSDTQPQNNVQPSGILPNRIRKTHDENHSERYENTHERNHSVEVGS